MSGILSRRRALLGLASCGLTLGAAGRLRANDLRISGFGQVICQAKGLPQFDYAPSLTDPAPEAVQAVNWITQTVGILPNFAVLQGRFEKKVGAFAAIRKGQRYVVYDSAEFSWQSGRTNWAETGVMAHEIGHHLGGHTAGIGESDWDQELEADRFAGFALGRLGARLDQALLWTADLDEAGSKTHPPRAQRIEAAQAGWRHAEAMKQREGPACEIGWLGEPVRLAGRQCRIASLCEPGRSVRIACQGPGGRWLWRR